MVRHRTKCVSILCKVTGVFVVWNFHNRPATFTWLRPASYRRAAMGCQKDIWPISEFPSQTCELLLLSYSVCHVTIAHCNDSNGTDTRVRVRCNDSDVTDRKQSRVCNDSTVTDMSWAIVTCDRHINSWQSKVRKPQNMELPYTECNLIAYARTLQCVGRRNWCIFIAVIVTCRQI